VLETALTLHHIWGVPYIPGSSLKGVCRQVAFWKLVEGKSIPENELENFQKKFYGELAIDNEDMLVYQLLFGAQDFKGLLLFLDVYPECNNEKIFKLDIMNPHYSKYYGDSTGRTPPGDWENPTPIFFLTVKEGVKFRFVVLFDNWRWEKIKNGGIYITKDKKKYLIVNKENTENKKDIENDNEKILKVNLPVKQFENILENEGFFNNILKQALSFYGVGSKTRLGYGSFKV
jgi:CRISPR-associated protein Cmr6